MSPLPPVQRLLLPPSTPGVSARSSWDLGRVAWTEPTRHLVELLHGHNSRESVEDRTLAVLGHLVTTRPGGPPVSAAAARAPLDGALAEAAARVARARVRALWPELVLLDTDTAFLGPYVSEGETRFGTPVPPRWLLELAGVIERTTGDDGPGAWRHPADTAASRRATAIRELVAAAVGYPWGAGVGVDRLIAGGLTVPDRALRERILRLTPALRTLAASPDYQAALEDRLGPAGADGIIRLPVRQTPTMLGALDAALTQGVDQGTLSTPEAWARQWLDAPASDRPARPGHPGLGGASDAPTRRDVLRASPAAWAGLLPALSGEPVVLPERAEQLESLVEAAIEARVRAATVVRSRLGATTAPQLEITAEALWGDGRGFAKFGHTNVLRLSATVTATGERRDGGTWSDALRERVVTAVVPDGGTAEDGVRVTEAAVARLVAEMDAELRATVPHARAAPPTHVEGADRATTLARRVLVGRPRVAIPDRKVPGADAVQLLAMLAGMLPHLDDDAAGRVLRGAELLGFSVDAAADHLDAWCGAAGPEPPGQARRRRERLQALAARHAAEPTTPPPAPPRPGPAPSAPGRRP